MMEEYEEISDFLISEPEIIKGLTRLGELASAEGLVIKLGLVGGAVMVLEYGARQMTHDVDAIILSAEHSQRVLELARVVANEYGWDTHWLNNDVEIFVDKLVDAYPVFMKPGIEVYAAQTVQMLALKLAAGRGPTDFADAAVLLRRMMDAKNDITQDEIWRRIKPYLTHEDAFFAEDNLRYLWLDTVSGQTYGEYNN